MDKFLEHSLSENFTYKTYFQWIKHHANQREEWPFSPDDFSFEQYSGLEKVMEFLESSWHLAFLTGIAYILGILLLQEFMKKKKPLKLQGLLTLWNITVGMFSLLGFARTAPELIKTLRMPGGFYGTLCLPAVPYRGLFWGIMFAISKVPELLDTVFVVLRKKPVEAAQWYHHLVTMVGCWILASYMEPVSSYMVVINFGVHGIMYPYFALKVAGYRVPRIIAKIITTCQFAQMVICFCVNVYSSYLYLSGAVYCYRHPHALAYAVIVNITFLILFGKLFYKLVCKSNVDSNVKKTK